LRLHNYACTKCWKVHCGICINKPPAQCPNASDCKIKYCRGCGGKLCIGGQYHLPSSHNHPVPPEGEDPDYGEPLTVGEFNIPELAFVQIIKDKLFPRLSAEGIPEQTIVVWSGTSAAWLPGWANDAIVDATTTVVSFFCSPALNTLAYWVRCLSRLVMSIVFFLAVMRYTNK